MACTISKTGYWSPDLAHEHHVFSPTLANWIAEYLADEKGCPLYDFGCGLGDYLESLKNSGFEDLTGFEGDPPIKRRFRNIQRQDLTEKMHISRPGNVLFLEVFEHIPAEFEQVVLDNVTSACSRKLIASCAIIDQPGFGHVNCQSNRDFIDKIEKRGFTILEDKTKEVRAIDLSMASWFKNTLFVFSRKQT